MGGGEKRGGRENEEGCVSEEGGRESEEGWGKGMQHEVRGGKADVWWSVIYDSYCLIKMILH